MAGTAVLGRLTWQVAEVADVVNGRLGDGRTVIPTANTSWEKAGDRVAVRPERGGRSAPYAVRTATRSSS
jgi:hypothetical protein